MARLFCSRWWGPGEGGAAQHRRVADAGFEWLKT